MYGFRVRVRYGVVRVRVTVRYAFFRVRVTVRVRVGFVGG